MVTIAAPSVGLALFGVFGLGGAAFIATVVLILGIKGDRNIKWNQNSAFAMSFITGLLWTLAGGIWTANETMASAFSESMKQGFAQGGAQVGPATAAGLMVALAVGKKMSTGLTSVLGILSPPLFMVAGGGFAIVTNLLTAGLTQMFGG